MKDTKKTFATVNFSNMITPAFNLLSTFQLTTNELVVKRNALDKARKEAIEEAIKKGLTDDKRKKYVTGAIENEKSEHDKCKQRCKELATAFIIRYVDTADAVNCELYKFDMKAFLTNIGVYTDGDDDKKALKRVEAIRALVVDRKETKCAKFNGKNADDNGNAVLSEAGEKTIKNTEIELVLAIVKACIESGAIEYSQGGLAFVKFDK